MVATCLKPLAEAREGKKLLGVARQRPQRGVGCAPKVAAPCKHQKIDFIVARASDCHSTIPALGLGLNFDGHTGIIERDVSLAHAHKRISPQEKRESQHAGRCSAAQEQRLCRLRQVQDARHDRHGNGPSRNHLLLIIFSLLLAETTTKQLNDMTDSGFLEAHIGVPRIDGREVLLQTTRLDALFIA
jgi:hypothetical protein